ncbi:MAG: 16S rRNA (cytosine(1402)-N(4))-methyltransferase RsmH [Bacteroidales bacterium]|nr:16S rRNA (cytosine(1402)-N(4))-methyltransferase RsmH [Bacteroidales bacterium]
MPYHQPVLLKESVEGLNIKPNGIYVDATFGGGGHSKEILTYLNKGRLIGFDQDEDAEINVPEDPRFLFVKHNFRFLKNFLRYYKISHVDGILADLGVSSHHFNVAERGFSFRFEGILDMRMNKHSKFSAKEMVRIYSEQQLFEVFRNYGELNQAKKVASLIVKKREESSLERIEQLVEILSPLVPQNKLNQFLAKVFQAIRIEVNKEMDALKGLLLQSGDVMNQKGRLVIISYHSLEDRLVKNYIRGGNFSGVADKDIYGNFKVPFLAINRKVIQPSEIEIKDNPRARSARLRIAEKM